MLCAKKKNGHISFYDKQNKIKTHKNIEFYEFEKFLQR